MRLRSVQRTRKSLPDVRFCLCLFITLMGLPVQGYAQQALSLAQAVRLGLAHAPEAHLSQDQVDLQQAQITGAKLRPNPRLFIQSEDLDPWNQSFDFPNTSEDYGYLSQTIELDGKRGKRIGYAQDGLQRTRQEHAFALCQLAARIADAYWATAASAAAQAEWQHQLADFNRIVQYQGARVSAGATAGVDLLRIQIERDRVELSYAGAQRDAEAAALELSRVTASPTPLTATLSDALQQERPVAERRLETALEQRPDVAAARDSVAEAEAGVRLQHAYGVPDMDLLGGYKRNVGANTLYGGLQIDLPLFNRNQGGIATAHASQQYAEDRLAYVRLDAATQIRIAVSAYTREQVLVHGLLPQMTGRAVRNAAIIADAYQSGGVDLLRYLDAERTLIDTRLLAIQTWTDYQRAAVALRLAYGEQP